MARRKHDFDPDEFDLNAEMEDGGVISDSRGGSYSVRLGGEHLGTASSMDEALLDLERTMDRRGHWPNVFHVNDHGNVNLLRIKRRMRKGQLVGVSYEIIHGWV